MPDSLPKWVTLDEAAVLTRLSGPEASAIKAAAKAPGQTNPLPEIVMSVVASVREACGQNPDNVLADGQTIPFSGVRHALAIVRSMLVTRLPNLAESLMDDVRRDETKTAEQWLRSKPLVAKPDDAAPAEEQLATVGIEIASRPRRDVTADNISGL